MKLQRQPGLLLAVIVYLALALAYFFIVPIFEGPDEWTHTGHVKYMAEGYGLPVMLPGRGIWGGQQPPLYYAVGALLMQPFDLDDFDRYEPEAKNPHASLGYALDPGNKNNYLHSPIESFPYHGLSLAVHVLRLYSMAYGLIALVFIYLTALEFFEGDSRPQTADRRAQAAGGGQQNEDTSSPFALRSSPLALRPSLFALRPSAFFATAVALFVACQPMFAFITTLVANEPANIAFSAVGLWLAQRYVLRGPSAAPWRAVSLGVVMGLIALAKMTGLSFGLVAVVAFLIAAVKNRRQPGAAWLLWRDGLIVGVTFLVVAGWWYWRNYQLYGDFFQQGLYKIYFNVDPQPLTLSEFLYTLSTGEISFWATFGWLNLVAPEWVYVVYRVISRIGLVGLVMIVVVGVQGRRGAGVQGSKGGRIGTFTSRNGPLIADNSQFTIHNSQFIPQGYPFGTIQNLLLHLLFPVALAFSLTRLVAIEGGLQGRQLLPALGSLAIVVIAGWWALCPAWLRRPVLTLVLVTLVGLAAWLPFGVVAPAYIPAPLLTEVEVPAGVTRLDWTYRDDLKLLGVKIGADKVKPGQRVPVTAYWQALRPMETNYSVFVHLIGRDYHSVGQFNTYPGLGLRPTRTLEPGQVVADTYPVLVDGGSEAPARLLVNIGLFEFDEPGRPGIPAVTSDGGNPTPTVGWLKLTPANWPAPSLKPPLADFSESISLDQPVALTGCDQPAGDCRVTLTWLARGQPAADYTVFIQLWTDRPQRGGQRIAGFDAPPLAGSYPTSLWEEGEVIIDSHPLDLQTVPPGEYLMLIGLYNFATGERLAATTAGVPIPDGAVNGGVIRVKEGS